MIDIYNALITRLTTATIANITDDDIAYDNADFDPTDKDAWLSTNFIPVERSTETKDSTGNVDTGLFQVDVFVPLNDASGGTKRYNLRALEIVNDILVAFADNTKLNFGDAEVFIGGSGFAAPLISESWYQIPVTINYTRI
jgi:hypothetical protein